MCDWLIIVGVSPINGSNQSSGVMTDWLQHDGAMAERIRAHDWASTPLGPLTEWPDVLKTSVALMLDSHFPPCIVWGESLTTLYNDAFVPI